VWDIEFMSLEDKIQLTYAWERLSGAQDWFSAIRGILKVGGERELVHPRSWFSRVDAHILYGIQEGIALLMNRRTKPGIASGYDWKVFFESEAAEVLSDDALIALWGKAELHSTNIGREVAESHGLTPSADEKSVLSDLGDVYRIGLHYRSVARDLAVFPPGAGYMLGEILDPRSEEWSYALASGAYWLAADASWPQPTLPLPLWFWMLQ
jgi:hypothetical protein